MPVTKNTNSTTTPTRNFMSPSFMISASVFSVHFHEAIARLAADKLGHAAIRGGVEPIGRAVVEDLPLARFETRKRIEHHHAVGHLRRRAHVVRHDDAGHRVLLPRAGESAR